MANSALKGKVLARLRYLATVAFAIVLAASPAYAMGAQAAKANQAIVGTWQGTLHAGRDLRIVVKVTKDDKGEYKTALYSIDQGDRPMPANTSTFQDGVFKFAITAIDGSYEGKMASDGNTIDGTWTQMGHSLPLTLTRATPGTE